MQDVTPGIDVRDLSVSYGSKNVLRGVTFSVAFGEFICVVGRSGSGKSTLLSALAGFVPRSGGEISVPADLGIVFQSHAVFPWLTVRGNIGFGIRGVSSDERNAGVNGCLAQAGLVDHADKYPGQLSGGQTQRVAFARALAAKPKAVLMDEPFGALDEFTREEMQSWLLRVWHASRVTIVLVTHNIEEALFLADRVLVIRDGILVADVAVPFERLREQSLKLSGDFGELKRKVLEAMLPSAGNTA